MKYCSNTHRRRANGDKLANNTSYGKSWNFIRNKFDAECRLCTRKSYPVHCTMCNKYSCIECTTIDEDFATMCHECLEIAEEKETPLSYEEQLAQWAYANDLAQCECGEYVEVTDENVFDDYEVYCKDCMKHMQSLV